MSNGIVSRNKLSDQVGRILTQEITSGSLPKDQPLPNEWELAEKYGVSRIAIREAIKVLSSKGLVSVRQGSGTYVNGSQDWRVLDPELLLATRKEQTRTELIQARQLIEPSFAAIAALSATPEELERIRLAIADDTLAEDNEYVVKCDRDFHLGIAEATHNAVLVVVMNSLNVLMDESRRAIALQDVAYSRRSIVDHRKIYEALVARDREGAQLAMLTHLEHVEEQVIAAAFAADQIQ